MASTLTNLLYHVVFSTKKRANIIEDDVLDRLHSYLGGIVRAHKGIALQVGGISDHVHMLIKLKAATPLSEIMRLVKAGSSKWMNEQCKHKGYFAWQSGYGAFSVSESGQDRVRLYIQNQKQHHQIQSFDLEYKMLLDKHRVAYDSQYLLG